MPFVVPAEPPSFDGHRETTFALIHPIAPFYSTLIRVNPDNPAATDDFVCDVCVEMPKAENQGKRYTFKIRKDVKFHNGEALTAHDIVASFQRIIFPPADVMAKCEYPNYLGPEFSRLLDEAMTRLRAS